MHTSNHTSPAEGCGPTRRVVGCANCQLICLHTTPPVQDLALATPSSATYDCRSPHGSMTDLADLFTKLLEVAVAGAVGDLRNFVEEIGNIDVNVPARLLELDAWPFLPSQRSHQGRPPSWGIWPRRAICAESGAYRRTMYLRIK